MADRQCKAAGAGAGAGRPTQWSTARRRSAESPAGSARPRRWSTARRRRERGPAVAAALFLLASGCLDDGGEAARSGASSVSVRDSAGVEIVESSRAAVEAAPALALVEELRIGLVEGPPEYQFVSIAAVGETPDGRILILDRRVGALRVFDAEGAFLMEIGRPGSGPGEFRNPSWVAFAGDTVVVGGAQLHVFAGSGLVRTTRPGGVQVSLERLAPTPAGWLAAVRRRGITLGENVSRGGPFVDTLVVGRVDLLGDHLQLRDTLLVLGLGEEYVLGPGASILRPIYARELQYALAGDGRVYSTPGDEYVVDVRGPSGVHIRRIVAEVEANPVSADDLEGYFERRRAWQEAMWARAPDYAGPREAGEDGHEALMRQVRLLPFRPIPGRLLPSPGGRLLVERVDLGPAPYEETERDRVWELFDEEGRIAGRLFLPPSIRPIALTDRGLWTATLDEMDVQYAVLYRLARP